MQLIQLDWRNQREYTPSIIEIRSIATLSVKYPNIIIENGKYYFAGTPVRFRDTSLGGIEWFTLDTLTSKDVSQIYSEFRQHSFFVNIISPDTTLRNLRHQIDLLYVGTQQQQVVAIGNL